MKTTAETTEAAQAAPAPAGTTARVWVAPEVDGFDTSMEVTAYAARR